MPVNRRINRELIMFEMDKRDLSAKTEIKDFKILSIILFFYIELREME